MSQQRRGGAPGSTVEARAPAGRPARARPLWPALTLAGLVGGVVGGFVGGTAVFLLGPPLSFTERALPRDSAPSPPAHDATPPSVIGPAPAVQAAPAPVAPPPAQPSRSRGRTDWMFFFKPGDQLVGMGNGPALGTVLRGEKGHTFPDGTTGPAYLLQAPDGGQRFVDADELERSARIE
jgi:hypothetical protein